MKADSCTVYGEGKMGAMGLDVGQVKIDAIGSVNHNFKTDSAKFELMIAMDFFFENSALEKMADLITKTEGLTGVTVGTGYEKGLRELLGKEKSDKLIAEINLYGKFKKFPDELEHTLFFTEVNMKWDKKTNAYVSEGPIGIGNIRKNQVNKYLVGKIAFTKKRTGDILDIYLELDKNNWYYFRYTKGTLAAVSGDPAFNNAIQDLKSNKRSLKTKRGQTPYEFSIGNEQQKNIFKRKYRAEE